MHEYKFSSPFLEGILSNSSVTYEGLVRPIEIFRVLDGPQSKGGAQRVGDEEYKVLAQYFHDVYGVFLKKLATFALEGDYEASEGLKLQAMLQEMIKVKKLLGRQGTA